MQGGSIRFARRLALSLLLVGAAAGCGVLDEYTGGDNYDPCRSDLGTAMVGGTWVISGEGERFDCEDPGLDVERFDLRSAPLVVAQDGRHLSLTPPVLPPGVTFDLVDGRVTGTCVDFRTVERDPTGTVTFEFTGSFSGGAVVGTFEGSGPDGCRTAGDFRIEVECCAGRGPDNPIPTDERDSIAEPTDAR